ncbi:hypothetical protein M1D48_12100 [Erwinia sp. D4-22]
MELGLVTPVKSVRKLQLAISSPTIALNIDLPEELDPVEYITFLSARVASDLRILSSRVEAAKSATITFTDGENYLLGDEMSERIAKIESSLEHLMASVSAMDAKLDKIISSNGDIKAANTVMMDKFVEYDKKLDKKPSKDEAQKWISQATTKQIIWTVGSVIALAVAALKFLP